ncbi:hypothetical protein BXY85_0154 [Roseivirga pacifica]|uniref:WD40-like Beta Propeller Repeat n=1 Tax=Roseivirga pacifica TaxID=1267423 RepID=A0A1I0R7G8_9BACT|nr:hypothetical protein [Roseivirga pacifica]RKQ49166.1 hypothetical protein BXY85_0154 [Roseivirga pacifica]SEW36682.1 hypothetical protein SAMN05216290_3207 [Roseivirga pacifica]
MKNLLRIVVSLLVLASVAQAQEIEIKEVDLPLSKEAGKAAKKGELLNAGTYWNSDKTATHNFYVYEDKKEGLKFIEFTVDNSGNVTSTTEEAYNAANLAKYNLVVEPKLTDDKDPNNLAGKEFGFFRKTVLAGNPKLNMGEFENNYVNGLWVGYKFKKGEQTRLEERFWPFVSFAIQDGVDNQHYQTRKTAKLGRTLSGDINYIPMDGKAFIAGLMATSDGEYISGVFDMATQTWDNKVITPMKAPIGLTYAQTDYGVLNLVSMSSSNDSNRAAILMDYQGNVLNKIELPLAQKESQQPGAEMEILEDGEAQFVVGPYYEGGNRKNIGLVIHKITDKLEFSKLIAIDQIEASIVEPPKAKDKFKKFYEISIETITKLKDGSYMLSVSSRRDPITTLILHLSSSGDLMTTYMIDGMEGDNNDAVRIIGKSAIHLDSDIIEANGSVYALIRSIPSGLEQGVHTSSDSWGNSVITTTVRIDELMAAGKIAKIDLASKSITQSDMFDNLLVGQQPYIISPDGTLIFNTLNQKKKERVKVLVK